ncbi:MAG: glycoside hydrolase family 43 protein [Bacteroidaceae bacterium]|nr:glycoside hydrolase family 43 protein [Bacteroidaceae bacterium]
MRYLFPSDYMADPSGHVFGDRLYIYPSHDRESGIPENDNGDHFDMRDYHVLCLDDPDQLEAKDLGCVLDKDEIPWHGRQLWDNDVVEKNGKYYLIYCLKDQTDIFRLGVAVSDTPAGPFKPLADPIRGSYSIDPCAFKDDDGEVYVYFGGLWGGQLQRYRDNKALESAILPEGAEPALPSRVVRMTEDVTQFAEEPRPVIITDDNGQPLRADDPHRFFEASWLHKHNGIYYFSYSTGDSHLLCYATSRSPYGPFRFRGELLQPVVGWTTHHSIVEWRGRVFLLHHDSVPSGGRTWLRSVKIAELEYVGEELRLMHNS